MTPAERAEWDALAALEAELSVLEASSPAARFWVDPPGLGCWGMADWQRDVVGDLSRTNRLLVRGGNKIGKTTLLSWIAWTYLLGWLPGRRSMTLEGIQVASSPMATAFPTIQTPLRADFGQPAAIELHGYALSPAEIVPGADLHLTLYWRAEGATAASYRVFLHLANANEGIVAQADGIPAHETRPTTSWRPGEVIVDERVVPIPFEVAPGSYRLWVGLYDLDTMLRLPAMVDGEQMPNDRVLLQDLLVR